MKSPTIEFISHASVIISDGDVSILSDPWFNGTAFHEGWRLMHELDDKEIINVLKKITHIYISHEHPDHFRPSFFTKRNIKDILLNKKVEFLFQHTKDKRVVNFLKEQGFIVKELNLNEKLKLNESAEIQIVKSGFYDSLLILKTSNLKIVNMNDCPIRDQKELKKFKQQYGTFDLLLTQFSYAAWKGGADNKTYRKIAANEKLETVKKQARILECKFVIPFASFIYFSNELNFYMNDSINSPEKAVKFLSKENANVVFLSPGEKQEINNLKQNQSSLNFWKQKYHDITLKNLQKKDKYNQSVSLKDLNLYFTNYKKKIFNKNSKLLIFALSKIKLMNFFQPIKIKLIDHNKIYNYSIFKGLIEDNINEKYDIKMHSQSLAFIFKKEFGFDTLTVNGCFEADNEGFTKVTKSLALGNLNAMGFNLNVGLIFNYNIIFLFLNMLRKVRKQLKAI